jgi:hypothetical protein
VAILYYGAVTAVSNCQTSCKALPLRPSWPRRRRKCRRGCAGGDVIVTGSLYLTDYRLNALEKNVEKLSTVVIQAARTDERLKDHDRRLDSLERR